MKETIDVKENECSNCGKECVEGLCPECKKIIDSGSLFGPFSGAPEK